MFYFDAIGQELKINIFFDGNGRAKPVFFPVSTSHWVLTVVALSGYTNAMLVQFRQSKQAVNFCIRFSLQLLHLSVYILALPKFGSCSVEFARDFDSSLPLNRTE